MLTTLDELNHEIMLRLDYKSTLQFCQTNSFFNKCYDVKFWEDKIYYDDHYLDIKNSVYQTIDNIERLDKMNIQSGISIKHFPPIQYILPTAIVMNINTDIEDLDLDAGYINIFTYHDIWFIKYYDFKYAVNREEIKMILIKSYYYHYNHSGIIIKLI